MEWSMVLVRCGLEVYVFWVVDGVADCVRVYGF